MTIGRRRLRRLEAWLDRRGRPSRPSAGDDGAGVDAVVVIPVLAESRRLFRTLESLAANAEHAVRRTLILCVVNNRAEHIVGGQVVADNQTTLHDLGRISRGLPPESLPEVDLNGLRLTFIDASSPGCELGERMGVGEARRIGLDHGLALLCRHERPDSLLVCLDADTVVDPHYLEEIRRGFDRRRGGAAVVGYAHPLPSDSRRREATIRYELFLRYHELGLRAVGSPYAIPTIGSTIVVDPAAYVAVGGMNRRQAGEDFYFLQQMVKVAAVFRIDDTTVRPSARSSRRVPFGTGASIRSALDGDPRSMTVCNPESYRILGGWLSLVRRGLSASAADLLADARRISPDLADFLDSQVFEQVWPKLGRNAPDEVALGAQFHRWFDGFRSLKLLHYLRDTGQRPLPVEEAAADLLGVTPRLGQSLVTCLEELLEQLRRACRDSPVSRASVWCWSEEDG